MVQVIDRIGNPGAADHFDCHLMPFQQIVGAATGVFTVGLSQQRVACPAYSDGIRVRLTDHSDGFWARLVLHNVGGRGTVSAVSMIDSSGATVAGTRSSGALWQFSSSNGNLGTQPQSLTVSQTGQPNAVTVACFSLGASWGVGHTCSSGTNFPGTVVTDDTADGGDGGDGDDGDDGGDADGSNSAAVAAGVLVPLTLIAAGVAGYVTHRKRQTHGRPKMRRKSATPTHGVAVHHGPAVRGGDVPGGAPKMNAPHWRVPGGHDDRDLARHEKFKHHTGEVGNVKAPAFGVTLHHKYKGDGKLVRHIHV